MTQTTWSIRPPVPDDIPALTDLRARRHGDASQARRWATRTLLRLKDRPDALMMRVVDSAEGLLGYANAGHFAPSRGAPDHAAPAGFYLLGLNIREDWQCQGLGQALTASRLDWIRTNAPEAWYFTEDENLISIALHQRFGFQATPRPFWFPGLFTPDAPMTLYRLRF